MQKHERVINEKSQNTFPSCTKLNEDYTFSTKSYSFYNLMISRYSNKTYPNLFCGNFLNKMQEMNDFQFKISLMYSCTEFPGLSNPGLSSIYLNEFMIRCQIQRMSTGRSQPKSIQSIIESIFWPSSSNAYWCLKRE